MPDLATILSGVAAGAALPGSGLVKNGQFLRPRWANVAAGCRIPVNFAGTSISYMCARVPYVMKDSVAALKFVFPNWFVKTSATPFTENITGAATSITAAIEYPAGTFTQITFKGAASTGKVVSAGEVVSDAIPISIPNGARFWVRTYQYNPNGIIFTTFLDTTNGAVAAYGAGAGTDQTMSGTITSSGTGGVYGPCAVLGLTSVSSVLLYGDSRTYGTGDTTDSTGDVGEAARSVGASLPYINLGVPGDYSSWQTANSVLTMFYRSGLARFTSHVVVDFGTNDMALGGLGFNSIHNYLQVIARDFKAAGQGVYFSTMVPRTTSSDSWATTANQTVLASEADRVQTNEFIRSIPMFADGYFEVADVLESARNSGFWKPGLTTDGIHATQQGYLNIQSAGAMSPATFVR